MAPSPPAGQGSASSTEGPDPSSSLGDAGRHALRVLDVPRVLDRVASHATGEAGAEHVRRLRPRTDPDAVRESLAAVEEMMEFLGSVDPWAPPRVVDAGPALRRLSVENAVLEGEQLRDLGVLLGSVRTARTDLSDRASHHERLGRLAAGLVPRRELRQRLERSFEDSGKMADGASAELRRLRRELRSARSDLVADLEAFAGGLPDRVQVPNASVTVRAGRYCVPIRREGRSSVGGIVHDESSSGRTLFVEPPRAIEPMNDIRELEQAEKREVRRVLGELTVELRPLADELSRDLRHLVRLDSLYARARYALAHGGSRPAMVTGGSADRAGAGDGRERDGGEGGGEEDEAYRVEEAYHPLLLVGDEEAVPFHLALRPDERVLLVSGPNAGGKTVLLKTIGLLSVLAQSGIIPPVGGRTRLPIFRRFFAIIGDEQSIEASLSTFSAQVDSLREILEESGPASLVLLDEFGSHTDPSEGAAIASAALVRLADRGALTVATTHLGALKALAGEDARVVNASLQFDSEALRPTYRLRRDRPGRSYALEIAGRLGLPEDLLEDAAARLSTSERRMEKVLADLEEREAEVSRLRRELRERAERLEARDASMTERARELDRREDEVERAARERAEAYLLEARAEVEAAIEALERERERLAAGEETRDGLASEARSAVERAVRESREAAPSPPEPPRERPEVDPGDPVHIVSLDRDGRVRELRGEEAVVETGNIRFTVPLHDLRPREGDGANASSDAGGSPSGAPRPRERRPDLETTTEINLHGLRTSEVEGALVPALDAAVVADLPYLRVIHGKGTGALRRRVRELLAEDRRVAGFRTADIWEGGSGVTIVEFDTEGDA